MNTDRLLANMIDQIKEVQLKLGYEEETVRLYYPLSSLNGLLGTEVTSEEEMLGILQQSYGEAGALGKLSFALHKGRVEVSIPPEGVEYVHVHVKEPSFLAAVIELFSAHHHCGMEEIRGLFERFSPDHVCEKLPRKIAERMGFDYVFYFLDPSVDAYYYCVKEEMGHTIYHRFTESDYRLLSEEAGTEEKSLS